VLYRREDTHFAKKWKLTFTRPGKWDFTHNGCVYNVNRHFVVCWFNEIKIFFFSPVQIIEPISYQSMCLRICNTKWCAKDHSMCRLHFDFLFKYAQMLPFPLHVVLVNRMNNTARCIAFSNRLKNLKTVWRTCEFNIYKHSVLASWTVLVWCNLLFNVVYNLSTKAAICPNASLL